MRPAVAALEPTDKTEIMLSVAPGVAADIADGSLGADSFVDALEKGLDQFRRWRRRARISFFNTGKKEAARIKNQSELLEKAFGRSLTPYQTERFLMLSDSLQKLTQSAI